MSEYFVGKQDDGADPLEPPLPGESRRNARPRGKHVAPARGRHAAPDPAPSAEAAPAPDSAPRAMRGSAPVAMRGSAPRAMRGSAPEHVRFGVPFNGVVPIWHDDTEITWHRAVDGTDFATVLGLGVVETEPGPSPAPEGWVEIVETGTLLAPGADPADVAADADSGPVLRLRAEAPTGRRAFNDPRRGAAIVLSPPLSVEEAMGPTAADFDITGFTVHVARLMLRAARDGAILLFTLRAPRDPEPHHLLSAPSEVDDDQIMHFHLGTLLEMEGGRWEDAAHADGMALLDLDVPYSALLSDAGPDGEQGLRTEVLIEMAQPVVDAVLKPGFPFALGCSFIMPRG